VAFAAESCSVVGRGALDYWHVSLGFTAMLGSGTYEVDYALLNPGGKRIHSDTAYIELVQPEERLNYQDTAFYDLDGVSTCQILHIGQSYGAKAEPSGACTLQGRTILDYWQVVLDFQAVRSDGEYTIEYALRDAAAARRYTATAFIDSVRQGERFKIWDTALSDLEDVVSCDILRIRNTDSGLAIGSGTCEVQGRGILGYWETRLEFTPDLGSGDYQVEYALQDVSLARLHTGTAFIDQLVGGQQVSYDDTALFEQDGVASCEILSISRY